VEQSTALRLQLAAKFSSKLPLLQSEEELTVPAKGPRLQPAEIFSELQLPRPEAKVLMRPALGLARVQFVAVELVRLELESPELARLVLGLPEFVKRSVAERRPSDAARSFEYSGSNASR
jgi:hypothetical protein